MRRPVGSAVAVVVAVLGIGLADGCGSSVLTSTGTGGSAAAGAAGRAGGTAGQGGHGGGAAGVGGQGGGPACGPVQCDPGMVCCNAACGICTPPGGGCVAGCPAGGSGGAAAGVGGHAGAGGAAGSSVGGAGGAAGTTGAGGSASGGGGGSASHGECTQASDCVLDDGCCACASVPKGTSVDVCNIECIASLCASRGITSADVACVSGRCALTRSCNPQNVICALAPPSCAAGSLPAVADGCYAGACLPASQCSDVGSCGVCTAAGLVCVTDQVAGGPTYHCVSVPSACSGAPTCACLGVCTGSYECAAPASTTPVCQCPTC
jgi:hypothetical protein